MKFKLDENLPSELASLFRTAGHDALSVLDQRLGGAPDERVAAVCRSEARVLVTLDLDFADIRTYPPMESAGIVILRLRHQDKPNILSVGKLVILAGDGVTCTPNLDRGRKQHTHTW